MINSHTYGMCLALLVWLALASRHKGALFCASVVTANWFIWSALCFAVDDYERWDLAFLLDSATAGLLFVRHKYFSLTFILLCVTHVAYGTGRLSNESWHDIGDWLGRLQLVSAAIYALWVLRDRRRGGVTT